MMNSEEVNRAANAVAAAEAELQELPLRDRTRRIQSVIAAQTTMIGANVPMMMTEAPPNPTLFVSNLPNETTREALDVLFRQFAGYRDVRLVPGREGIAFIDFDNEGGAGSAKGKRNFRYPSKKINLFSSLILDALNGFKVSATHAINVNFANK